VVFLRYFLAPDTAPRLKPSRLWLPALQAAIGSFMDAYRTVAWLCSVPNAIAAEIIPRARSSGDRRGGRAVRDERD